jgi:curved DNA-binding protein CbpA
MRASRSRAPIARCSTPGAYAREGAAVIPHPRPAAGTAAGAIRHAAALVERDDDHYAALDLEPDATRDEIRAAWRFLLVAFHPDRFRDPGQRRRAEEITKRVNAAWQVLGDEALRRRYDRTAGRSPARGAQAAPAEPPRRELPCPSCASRFRVSDAGGRVVQLACPACGETFPAMIGARCLARPRLEKRWMGLRYEAHFRGADGVTRAVSFQRLPQELALSEGELMSIVFHPRRARPVYAIVHGEGLDIGWRVR